jgi:hypothetical protein
VADLRFDDIGSDVSADEGCVPEIIERDRCGVCKELRESLFLAVGKYTG